MEKPYTIRVQEFEQKIVELINNSQLQAHTIKASLQNIYAEVERLDNAEIEKYKQELQKEYEEKESE